MEYISVYHLCVYIPHTIYVGMQGLHGDTNVMNVDISNSNMSSDSDISNSIPLGRQGQSIDLMIDCPCELKIVACSAKNDDMNNTLRDSIVNCFT